MPLSTAFIRDLKSSWERGIRSPQPMFPQSMSRSGKKIFRWSRSQRERNRSRNNKTLPASWKGGKWNEAQLNAADIGCLEAFGPLQQVKFNRFALVKTAIAVL